jgi:flagellar biosynthetic protein FliQ
VTSIQEQTLSFVPKLFAVAVTFIVLLSWMLQTMMRFTSEVFLGIPGFVS